MTLINIRPDSCVLELEKQEIGCINNALNEVCNGIDIAEFETRLGCSVKKMQDLLSQVSNIVRRLDSE